MSTQRGRGLRVWSAIISSIWNARPTDHDSDLLVRASDVGIVISLLMEVEVEEIISQKVKIVQLKDFRTY